MLGAIFATLLGLPIAPFAVVEVDRDLIRMTEELAIKIGHSLTPCCEGFQFGSRYVCNPLDSTVYAYLRDYDLVRLENVSDFLGMLVFDKWTGNTDPRQVLFHHQEGHTQLRATMIDQGYCFNGDKWDFPDKSFIGLYPQQCVYRPVCGLGSFDRWLEILEDRITADSIEDAAAQVPPEWYNSDERAFNSLIVLLNRRRSCTRKLLTDARAYFRLPFPNWK